MISRETFPEYFYKEDIQEEVVDASYDVNVFAEHIAPMLGIQTRFAGEEPNDKVTESYNRTMERLLKRNGIGFCEIPRACDSHGPISATRVRKCMEDMDIEGLRGLVPETTLRIIMEKYMKRVTFSANNLPRGLQCGCADGMIEEKAELTGEM